jgi:hypothetical protein
MFVGHYAVAMTAKKAAPKVSLGTLVLACQILDLLWSLFLLVGLERVRIDPGNTVAILALIHAGNIAGPPPPSVRMIAYAGNALWLFVAWAY